MRLITEVDISESLSESGFHEASFELQALQDLPGVGEALVNKQISTATARLRPEIKSLNCYPRRKSIVLRFRL